jgi:hypothetical protein
MTQVKELYSFSTVADILNSNFNDLRNPENHF